MLPSCLWYAARTLQLDGGQTFEPEWLIDGCITDCVKSRMVMQQPRLATTLANRIRELAKEVRSIGRGRRCDAESIAIDKDCIAVELGSLARRLEGRAVQ